MVIGDVIHAHPRPARDNVARNPRHLLKKTRVSAGGPANARFAEICDRPGGVCAWKVSLEGRIPRWDAACPGHRRVRAVVSRPYRDISGKRRLSKTVCQPRHS
jgi:hypothetical protein